FYPGNLESAERLLASFEERYIRSRRTTEQRTLAGNERPGVSEELGEELNIEIQVPGMAGTGVERELAYSMMAGGSLLRQVDGDCWELSLDDATELRRQMAEALYGDVTRVFRLYLHRR